MDCSPQEAVQEIINNTTTEAVKDAVETASKEIEAAVSLKEEEVSMKDSDFMSESHEEKILEESCLNNNSLEDTDDEVDDEEETNKFLSLMSKAERKNQKRLDRKQKLFPAQKSDWRDVTLDDPDDDTSDTDDEDDTMETRKFLYMLQNAKKKTVQTKRNMVNVRWKSGRVEVSQLPDSIKVTRVPAGEDAIRKQQDELARRREEVRSMDRSRQDRGHTGGKRKFEERMTLTEAKLGDFQDSKDYVDFIQSKLQNVNIKIVK
eukprot:GFUD01029834.1.p1 GENE.GFUD01029834.1~~GFUD01029834.1.p1  ORF type:complete len:262 (+),score=97.05 GFUD01029834.1:91-876(+)